MTTSSTGSTDAVSTAPLEALLRASYGLDVASLKFLGGELDQNYRVITVGGDTFLAKLQLQIADRGELQWQEDILVHLAGQELGVAVPAVVRTTDGRLNLRVDIEASEGVLRVLEWVDGTELVNVPEHSDKLLSELGATAATITRALDGFASADLEPTHHWDVTRSRVAIEACIADEPTLAEVPYVQTVLDRFDAIAPLLGSLPKAVIHHDLNDNNVLVDMRDGVQFVSGVLDFNDALYSPRVAELAVACAYAMLRKDDPLGAMARVVAGYHEVAALTEDELAVLYPLATARLCVQVLTWTARGKIDPTAYGAMRMRYTLPALRRVVQIDPYVATEHLRVSCGKPPAPAVAAAREVAETVSGTTVLRMKVDLIWADRSVQSEFGAEGFVAPGPVWASEHLSTNASRADIWRHELGEPETVSIGTAVWSRSAVDINTPLAGRVVGVAPLIIEHTDVSGGAGLYSVWRGVRALVSSGDEVDAGRLIAEGPPGTPAGESAWRLQLTADRDFAQRLPDHVRPTDVRYWAAVCIDPGPWFGAASAQRLSATSVDASTPVRGTGVWLLDNQGRRYLDCADSSAPLGHGEPRITAAAHRQMRLLGTAGGFLSYPARELADRVIASLPTPLDTVLFVGSAREANDVAGQLARRGSGLRVADETITGLGRTGTHFWRFEAAGPVPDIVTIGRGLGNGHPIAAVVTTQEIARAGGLGEAAVEKFAADPVSGAIGLAVLDILDDDALRAHAADTGDHLITALSSLQTQFPSIESISGSGLAIEVQLADDADRRGTYARAVQKRLRTHSVIVGRGGADGGALLITPPLIFSRHNADLLVERLSDVLIMADIRPAATAPHS